MYRRELLKTRFKPGHGLQVEEARFRFKENATWRRQRAHNVTFRHAIKIIICRCLDQRSPQLPQPWSSELWSFCLAFRNMKFFLVQFMVKSHRDRQKESGAYEPTANESIRSCQNSIICTKEGLYAHLTFRSIRSLSTWPTVTGVTQYISYCHSLTWLLLSRLYVSPSQFI